MYRIELLDAAIRDLASLDKPVARRIAKRLQWLAENFERIQRISLRGEFSDFYKFRVGDYRVLYRVLEDEKCIQVHAIGHRSQIYRGR